MIKAIVIVSAGLMLIVVAGFVVVLVAVTGGGAAPGYAAVCATDANLAAILATIRQLESGGDYTAVSATSTASGAYQFLDGTWHGYGGYRRAADASAAVQDQKAAEHSRSILIEHSGDISTIPVVWYIGHVPEPGSGEWDGVPDAPGNSLTPRQYQTRWLEEFQRQQTTASVDPLSCAVVAPTFTDGALPDHLDCARLSWGGYPNGHIPAEAMRHRPHSTLLHPAASEAFDQLYAAAQQAGFDLRGAGYRPVSAGGSTAGRSCHGLGLAVDITVLVPGNKYPSTDRAFASPEFAWLCANSARYGWIIPRWALPAGARCGNVVGTGAGGHRGNQCCFLEPWHIEAAGTVVTHADFTP